MIRTLAAGELLDAWDAGAALPPSDRTGPLLRAATGLDGAALAGLALGQRDWVLVRLRERLFGDRLLAVVECPICAVTLELALPTGSLLATGDPPDTVEVTAAGYRVSCRLLRPADLADASASGSAEAARSLLVSRAVDSAERNGRPVPVAALPAEVIAAVSDALAAADPLADIELPISCDACGATWSRRLDIDSYLWRELDVWAARMLDDIHRLASSYGWSESEILAMPPRRRQHYVERAGYG